MMTITLLPSGRRIEARSGDLLGDRLVSAGIDLNLYCGRCGVCGKCFVEIEAGALPAADDGERILLAEKKLDPGRYRLACRYRITGDVSVRIPEPALIPQARILSSGSGREIALDPIVRKICLHPVRPDLQTPLAYMEGLKTSLERPGLRAFSELLFSSGKFLSRLPDERGFVTAVIAGENDLLALEPGDTQARLYGVALDLGTTTLAADLVDLTTGARLSTAVGLNGQASFGADVVSRISAAFIDPVKADALKSAVLDSINALIADLCRTSGVAAENIYETVVAGNTPMNHLLLGLPVDRLAVAPFASLFSVAPPLPASQTGFDVNPLGRVYLAPNLQSFIGGDVIAGVVAIDLPARAGNVLFLDLGTNGELVLKTGRGVSATSTAAGPAFEGMSISCGLPAGEGAVDKAVLQNGGAIDIETIGGGRPLGVCGTGLIDLVASFLRRGDLSREGRISVPGKKLSFAAGLSLSAADIREVQLAAAAVKTGIKELLAAEGLAAGDLDEVLVAGAFGAYLNIGSAEEIGLLPRLPRGRVKFVGNTSLEGARALLLSGRERRAAEGLAREIRHLPLAREESFLSTFVESLAFDPWPASASGTDKEDP